MNLKELKIACYLYNNFTNFDKAYGKIFNIQPLDIKNHNHIIILLNWLRDWGCRQFKKEYDDASAKNIVEWYTDNKSYFPKPNISLQNTIPDKVEIIFNDLADKTASKRNLSNKRVTVKIGPVGAAKILFAFRPKVFPPWDTPICKELKYAMSGEGYVKYLSDVQQHLFTLNAECQSLNISINDLPVILNREKSSLPKLIDEFNWITITKKINTQQLIDIIKNYG